MESAAPGPKVPTVPSVELRRRRVVPPLPRNISEQEDRITEVVAITYQGILATVQEELEQLFDVQRSTLGVHSGYMYDLQENFLHSVSVCLRVFNNEH
jgi:actin-like ATPase involved in cell morphogenesis